jgi:metallophosphoesterase (TIGR00282 family)
MIGDVAGEAGVTALEGQLPPMKAALSPCVAVVNGENAAGGFGLNEACLKRILAAGADVITSGNHIWEDRDFYPVMEAAPNVLRPANYPQGTAGRGLFVSRHSGIDVAVLNLQGREFMTAIDCPFRTFDRIYDELSVGSGDAAPPIILIDFHAESSREKEALAFYLNGRAAVVAGTHTHVQTADERILPGGKTAYITDLGLTGALDSVIGMDTKVCLARAARQVAYKMECAKERPAMQGIRVDIDIDTRLPVAITRFCKEAAP